MRSTEGECEIHGIRAIREETNPELKAIPTAAQYEQLHAVRQQEIKEMIEKKRAAQYTLVGGPARIRT